MPLRVETSNEDGIGGNWLDVVERWTRKELALYRTLSGDAFMDLWQKKIVACHIKIEGGEPITDPAQVWPRNEEIDLRVWRFITHGPLEVTNHLLSLGEASGRLSLPGAVAGPMDRR